MTMELYQSPSDSLEHLVRVFRVQNVEPMLQFADLIQQNDPDSYKIRIQLNNFVQFYVSFISKLTFDQQLIGKDSTSMDFQVVDMEIRSNESIPACHEYCPSKQHHPDTGIKRDPKMGRHLTEAFPWKAIFHIQFSWRNWTKLIRANMHPMDLVHKLARLKVP